MTKQVLNKNWSMGRLGSPNILAAVPGSVYGDLLAAGKMDDPFYRDNETAARALYGRDLLAV